MNFHYQQTVMFEQGGHITVAVTATPGNPLSLADLSFVVDLAERMTLFEHHRAVRKAKELATEQARARRRETPFCWPGFQP